jgi:molecular chaperone DnaJ
MFSFSSPCRNCQGRGSIIREPCPTCHGAGIERRPREVRARIPAGVSDGQTIRLKGRGAPGRNSGPAGDLLVEIHVRPDARFGRSGNNLTVTLPVTFAEAALGGDIEVPTIEGTPVTLRLRPGTPSGSRHRVKGKGITVSSKRNGETIGDLIVTVEVDVPAQLTDEQRAAVEQLAAATTVNPRTSR